MGISEDLELALNKELIRRLLIKYFSKKGFSENFDKKVYPPIVQDLVESAPEFQGKIEIEPYALEVDPQSGFARLGWNLFVLGSQRMYLGETEHSELRELARRLESGHLCISEDEQPFRYGRTARDIINWIARVLGKSEAGIIRSVPINYSESPRSMGGTQSGSFFERPRAIRPEGTSQF